MFLKLLKSVMFKELKLLMYVEVSLRLPEIDISNKNNLSTKKQC